MRRYDPCNGDCRGIRRNDKDGELMFHDDHVEAVASAVAAERERCAGEVAALREALSCPSSSYGTHRCVRCDSEVEGAPAPREG